MPHPNESETRITNAETLAMIALTKTPDISATLAERGGRYGQFIDHAKISQGLQDVMREAPNWDKLEVDMRQALTTIVDKIARILNGDPYYDDSWHDISGYATLVERRLIELKDGTKQTD